MKIPKSLFIYFLAFCFIFIFYGSVLLHPNSYLFADSGDGLKNYFTYLYHIKNDTSWVNFSGMNYPFGENFMYTDCHPVLANAIKLLSNFVPGISDYSIGIVNFLMIISIFITIILTHKVFTLLKVSFWLSAFSAIAITALAPQVFRITGHLALSYSCFIPLTFYLLIKHSNSDKKYYWSAFLMINNLIWFFVHAYLGIMTVFFQFSFWVISWLMQKKEFSRNIHLYLHLLLTVILPVILFRLFILVTDHHTGRTDNPSGFFLYNAEPDDILVPHHPPLGTLLNAIPGLKINLEWEAWSYIGLTSILVLLAIAVAWISSKTKKTPNPVLKKISENKILTQLVLSSLVLLLFAMGIPFKHLPVLLEWFPAIKQFRATGRFTWFFFFAITIFSIYAVHIKASLLISHKKKWLAYIVMIAAPALYLAEGIPYHTETSKAVRLNYNFFDANQTPPEYKSMITALDPARYQAIIPLPFFYQGSESYSRPCNKELCKYSMTLAFHLRLPVMAANLTRTSVEESKKIVQLVSPGFYPKLIRNDITSDKPFLVIKSNEMLTGNEEYLLAKCKEIYRNDEFSLFELSKNALFENTAKSEITAFENIKNTLKPKNGFLVTDTASFMYYNSFDDRKTNQAFRGKGAFSGIKKGKNVFAGFPPNTFKTGHTYIVSLWMYNNYKDALNNWLRFMIEEHDIASDTYYTTVCLPEQCETIFGNWSMVELRFTVNNPGNEVCIATKGKDDDSKIPLLADDILIRESNTDVYRVDKIAAGKPALLFKNNHYIEVK